MGKRTEAFTTMSEVRDEVDRIDRALVALLRERFDCMDAAARIKGERETVRDEARKAEVVAAARALAEGQGMPADAIAAIWDALVEASIAYEYEAWDRLREG